MAAQYTLTGTWAEITETSGTAQNVGYESVELVSDTNQEAGEGITLLPGGETRVQWEHVRKEQGRRKRNPQRRGF